MRFEVLDHGYIEIQGILGSDLDIVNAARVSFLGETKGEAADKKLLFYLMKNGHHSPFEQAVIKLRVSAPLFVTRQWFRYRTHSVNERSLRYSEYSEKIFYTPDKWRSPDKDNKQSSDDSFSLDGNMYLSNVYTDAVQRSFDTYDFLLEQGVARELARMILPTSIYTTFVDTVDLRNLLHFIKERSDTHAQWEIQQYSNILKEIVKEKFPWTYEAATEYGVI